MLLASAFLLQVQGYSACTWSVANAQGVHVLLGCIRTGYALDTDETQVPAVLPPDVDLATPSPRGGKPAEITPSPVSAAVAREGDFPDVDGDVFLTRREQLALRRRGHVTADAKPKKKASPKRKGKGKGKGKKWRKSTCSGSKTVPEQIEEPVPSEPLEQEVEEPVPSEPLEHEVEEPVPKPKKAAPKRKAIVVEPTEEPKESVDPKPKKKAASKRKAVVVEEPEAKPKKKAAPKRKAVVVEEPEELEAKPKKRAAPKRKAVVEEEPTEEPEKAVEEPKGKRVRAKNAVIEYSAPLSRRQLRNALLCQFQECHESSCRGPTAIGQFPLEAPVRLVPYWTKCQLGIKVLHVKDGQRELRQPYYISGSSPCWCSLVLCAKQVAAQLPMCFYLIIFWASVLEQKNVC